MCWINLGEMPLEGFDLAPHLSTLNFRLRFIGGNANPNPTVILELLADDIKTVPLVHGQPDVPITNPLLSLAKEVLKHMPPFSLPGGCCR